MTKQKIIIFSNNLEKYSTSSVGHIYQAVLDEFELLASIYFYGPGFPYFDKDDSVQDVLSKSPFDPDYLVFAHQWLIDVEGTAVDPQPSLNLRDINYPKICILNKEYVNLENKLAYLIKNQFDLVFTHHHKAEYFSRKCEIPFIFLPLGYNHRVFCFREKEKSNNNKSIDLLFSGILQNSNPGVQSDLRRRAMKKLFFCIGDIPVRKKRSVQSLNIFWNGQPRSRFEKLIARRLGIEKVLPINEYIDIQSRSKITLNTLSPAGLVSSRHMECMALKSLVFAEESNLYQNIFPDDLFIQYKNDLSDILDKLKYYLDNDHQRIAITERAYKYVIENHTWENRVKTVTDKLKCLKDGKFPFKRL